MFGNLPGWIIAAVLAASTSTLIYWKGHVSAPPISRPTGALKVMLAKASMSPEPRDVLKPGAGDQDAGGFYRSAAERVANRKQAYRAFDLDDADHNDKPKSAKPFEDDVKLLVTAAGCARMNLFAGAPGEVVNYKAFLAKPLLFNLQLLSEAAMVLALEYKKTDPATTRKYREAVFHLGRNLYEERQAWVEYELGLQLMEKAAFSLAKAEGADPGQAAALEKLSGQCGERHGGEVEKLLHESMYQFGQNTAGASKLPHVGDVFEVATKSEEPFWQAQAVLRLGVLQRSGGVGGYDQAHARKLLDELSARSDLKPNVKAAVTAAKALVETPTMTQDQKDTAEAGFNMSGGNY